MSGSNRAGGSGVPSFGSGVEIRDLSEPEAVVTYPLGATYQVRLAGTVVSRHVLQPGWNWEAHAQPQVGTASCELYHRGVVLSGRMGVRTDEGEEVVIGPNQVFDLPPGHVTWVDGDEELVMVDWAGGAGFDVRPGESTRVMASILFTDMVGSTEQARKAGDAAWKQTVAMHDDVVRTVLVRFGGREVETAGDSFLIVFDGAERAIRCGLDLVEALAAIDIPIRVGIHSGEVALTPEHVRGVAVHAAARILDEARPGEVLVSGTTRDLAEGSAGLAFEPRGRYRLKGLEGDRDLFAAAPSTG
jgi:class 3 adenylate cyclase